MRSRFHHILLVYSLICAGRTLRSHRPYIYESVNGRVVIVRFAKLGFARLDSSSCENLWEIGQPFDFFVEILL